jgi:DNA-binding NarL/FixJ family response regulator
VPQHVVQEPVTPEGQRADAVGRRRVVQIESLDETIARIVEAVLTFDGWALAPWGAEKPGALFVLTESSTLHDVVAARSLLLCGARPLACSEAMKFLVSGRVGAVLAEDRLDSLSAALDALHNGRSLLTADFLERVRRVPSLHARQREVLARRLHGESTSKIAVELHVSLATIKRDVARLHDLFEVTSPAELVRVALQLGFGHVQSGPSRT